MVFVIKDDGSKDLTPALEFGEIRVLTSNDLPLFGDNYVHILSIKEGLFGFCDKDHLLLVGDPVAIGVAVYYAAMKNRGRVSCLKWDKRARSYFTLQLKL